MLPMFMMAAASIPLLAPGDHFPELKGGFLTGKVALLPAAASGRVALLALGFTYESRYAVEAWAERFRKEFGEKPDVTFFEIPMIGGIARMGKWFIDEGMRRGTPAADRGHVITVYGGTDLWKQRLGVKAPASAYLILLDTGGNVLWMHEGPFEEQAFADLARRIAASIQKR